MPKYAVDIKAFINIEIEADNAADARAEAERLVESCEPDSNFIDGWNSVQRQNGGALILETGCFAIDGESEVDELD